MIHTVGSSVASKRGYCCMTAWFFKKFNGKLKALHYSPNFFINDLALEKVPMSPNDITSERNWENMQVSMSDGFGNKLQKITKNKIVPDYYTSTKTAFLHPFKLHVLKISNMQYDRPLLTN